MEAQKIGHIGSWEWDLETREMSCSDEFYNIMNLDPIVFGKSYEAMMEIVHPEDRPKCTEKY